jgi:hypothetical protein
VGYSRARVGRSRDIFKLPSEPHKAVPLFDPVGILHGGRVLSKTDGDLSDLERYRSGILLDPLGVLAQNSHAYSQTG